MRRRSLVGLLSGVCLATVLSSCSTGEPNATTTEVTFSPSTPPTSSFAPTSTTGRVVDSNFTEIVLVVGDWGSGTVPQGAVAGAMERYARDSPIRAVLTTGDNFYSDDAEFLMQPYQWVTRSGIDWWVTWGNYDVESQTRINVVNDAFGDPPRWTVLEWGEVDIVILDSNQVTSLTQAAFFLDAMAASDRPMVIALHHPPFSCSHQGATTEIVNQWVGILDSDVVMVLSGHDHSYQRFEDNGVTYIVSGGGGRELRPLTDCPDDHPERLAGAELHHFVALEQTNDAILITAIDVNGDTFDEWSIPLP